MTNKILIISAIAIFAIGFGLADANAQQYTLIGTPVTITAGGVLSGSVTALTAGIVAQATGSSQSQITFSSPSSADLTNSGSAIKVTGGTNDIDARIILYTDNSSYFPNNAADPAWGGTNNNIPTGLDGGGMPGTTISKNVVPLVYGLNSASNGAPNTNVAYAGFIKDNLSKGIGCVYLVDARHTYDFLTAPWVTATNARLGTSYTLSQLDTMTLYKADGSAAPANTAQEGYDGNNGSTDVPLIPHAFGDSYYDSTNPATRKLICEALYRNISTVAYGIQAGANNYTCNCPNLAAGTGSVTANLAKTGGTTDQYLYIYIGADFTGQPWQTYTTSKVTVAMVKG